MYSDLRESLHRIQSLSWPKLKQIIRVRPSSGIVDMMMQYTIFKSFLHDSQQKNNIINPTNNPLGVANMVPNSSLCPTHWELPTHCSPKFPLKLIKTSPPASTRTTPPVCLTSMLGVGECEASKTHTKSMVSRDLTWILRCRTVIFRSTYQGLYIYYIFVLYYIILYYHIQVHSAAWWWYHTIFFFQRISFHFAIGVLGCPGCSTLFGCVQNHIRSFACWMMINNPLYVSGPPTKILLHNNVWLAWSGGGLLINALRKL